MLNSADRLDSPLLYGIVIHRQSELSTGCRVGANTAHAPRLPPVVEFTGGMYCVPTSNISTKVRSGI